MRNVSANGNDYPAFCIAVFAAGGAADQEMIEVLDVERFVAVAVKANDLPMTCVAALAKAGNAAIPIPIEQASAIRDLICDGGWSYANDGFELERVRLVESVKDAHALLAKATSPRKRAVLNRIVRYGYDTFRIGAPEFAALDGVPIFAIPTA